MPTKQVFPGTLLSCSFSHQGAEWWWTGFTVWMDVNVCVILLSLVHLELHDFSVVSLHCGMHSSVEGILHTSSFPRVFWEWCEHVSPKPHFLHLPENFSPTQSKGIWWPLVVSRVTQVRETKFQWQGGTFLFTLFCAGKLFSSLHEK